MAKSAGKAGRILFLVERERNLKPGDIESAYKLSFGAYYRLEGIHPWRDGNGRMARLVMNIIQREAGVILSIVKESRAEYIKGLADSQAADDNTPFMNFMMENHLQHKLPDTGIYRINCEMTLKIQAGFI